MIIIGLLMLVLIDAATAQEAPILFEDEREKFSYALGMAVGNKLRTDSIEVNAEFYIRGFKDALSNGETRLTEGEARKAINALRRELRQRRAVPQFNAPSNSPAGSTKTAAHDVDLTGIEISYKLDPRLTRSLYMGERWVSPPTFTYANPPQGEALAVEARSYGLNGRGGRIDITPEWETDNDVLVRVVPAQGHQVKLVVLGEGESRVKVSYGNVAKELVVRATSGDGELRVDITQ